MAPLFPHLPHARASASPASRPRFFGDIAGAASLGVAAASLAAHTDNNSGTVRVGFTLLVEVALRAFTLVAGLGVFRMQAVGWATRTHPNPYEGVMG